MSDSLTHTKANEGRQSIYGFYCSDCNEFVYEGYDSRDKIMPRGHGVCLECGKFYSDKPDAEVSL